LQSAAAAQSRIVIDLASVAYVSSRAWGVLAAHRRTLPPGGEIAVVGMRPEMEAVFRTLGFETILRHGADARAAFAAAPTPPGAAPPPAPSAPEPASQPALAARTANAGDAASVTILTLTGVLDTTSALALERHIETLVESQSVHVLADVSGLEFVSSAGWGTLAAALPKLRAAGGELRLFGLSHRLRHVFQLLNLDRVLPAHDVLAEALGAFAVACVASAVSGPGLDTTWLMDCERGRDAALRELGWDEYCARLYAAHATEAAA
jgi:anti-anti-sigma factor